MMVVGMERDSRRENMKKMIRTWGLVTFGGGKEEESKFTERQGSKTVG